MDADSKISSTSFNSSNIILALIYIFANLLFVWKYISVYVNPSWLLPLGYAAFSAFMIFIPLQGYKFKLHRKIEMILYLIVIAVIAVVLIVIMLQFEPDNIGLARYAAAAGWLTDLFNGVFPYAPDLYVSGFPFLFALAMPFYFLGNIGLLQIFCFIIFAGIIYFHNHDMLTEKLRVVILLLASPLFLYEVVARSELFSNTVLVLLYLILFERYYKSNKAATIIILGLAGGLLLSTRGIVLLIYIIYLGYLYVKNRFNLVLFLGSMFASFLITLLPFIIWNMNDFINYGPFAIQMWYIPKWFLLTSIIAAVLCACFVKAMPNIYLAISIMLFAVVLFPFIVRVTEVGLINTIFNNYFDISYLSFAQPFVLLSFKR